MRDMSVYVFLDEGGNFDFSSKGTQYFVLSAIVKNRSFIEHALLAELKYDVLEETGDCHEYFHATEDRQIVRDRVFRIIQSRLHHCQIYSLIVLKQVVPEVFWDEKRFYPEMLGQLLGQVISSSRWVENAKLYIVTDSLPVT